MMLDLSKILILNEKKIAESLFSIYLWKIQSELLPQYVIAKQIPKKIWQSLSTKAWCIFMNIMYPVLNLPNKNLGRRFIKSYFIV